MNWRSAQARARALWTVVVIAATAGTAVSLAGACPLRVNFTGSLPRGLYRIRGGTISHGAIVIACLPASVGSFARERDYLWRGNCPGNAAPVGKIVAAVTGDTVVTSAAGLTVNGHRIQNTGVLLRDTEGRRLSHIPYATYVVARGQLWLISSYNSRSYDSRYFGPIPFAAVRSRIEPVLTVGSNQAK